MPPFLHVLVFATRYGAGGNKSAHSATALSAKKLEEADDVGKKKMMPKTQRLKPYVECSHSVDNV
jgi:hypothetical protein